MKTRLIFLLATFVALNAGAAERPNFLFIYTDDQRWDAMGVVQREQGERARFPWFTTPSLDRLAASGVRFRNAFVVLSLCSPSRAAFLTGRYNHANGIVDNHTPFPADGVTHAMLLRAAGYKTGYIGKWHMGPQKDRPGFDYAASFVGQGKYFDCPIVVNGNATPSKGWVDDVSTDYALDFLKQNKEQPFSLVLGFKTCHGPFQPAERAKARFAGEQLRPVPNLDTPAIYKEDGAVPAKKAGKKKSMGGEAGSAMSQLRGLSGVDDNLGRLLDALDELKLADRTVIVFTSDNGYYMREHGLGDKRTAYEEAMRIPMLVRWPKNFPAGRALDELALNIDIAPTFLELAGLPVPPAMHGRSLVPLLSGKASDWRKAFFYEYFQEQGQGAPTVLAVRTATAKLVKYPGHDDWTELFDLKADPYETRNLARDPAHQTLLVEMRAEFDRQAKAVDFRMPATADKSKL